MEDVNIGTSDPFYFAPLHAIKVNIINVLPLYGELHAEAMASARAEYGLAGYNLSPVPC